MTSVREDSLSPLALTSWRWDPFFNDLIHLLSDFDIEGYSIPRKFLARKAVSGSSKNPIEVSISTWACKINKIRQIRAACIQGDKSLSVFNLVINPLCEYDLPFFGADFVTLPNGHLLALDLQPALRMDAEHTKHVWSLLRPIHNRWQSLLPNGGPIPEEAKCFFSPGFLWTRLPLDKQSDTIIAEIIRPAFNEYLSLYLKLVKSAKIVSTQRSKELLQGQKSYINYRSKKDPARGMLTRFYGKEWTEDYIQNVLFNI